jgi:hypothetical protein
MGARIGSVGDTAKQLVGNVGKTLRGDVAGMQSHKGVYQDQKQLRIVQSIVKSALDDIVKLGLLGKGYVAKPEDTKDLTDLLNTFITDKRGSGFETGSTVTYNPKTGKPNIAIEAKDSKYRYNGNVYQFAGINGWTLKGKTVDAALQKEITEDMLRTAPDKVEIKTS